MTYEPASLSNRGTRSRAEGDGRSDMNQCCDMKADLGTIGPEATLKARRCVGPTRASTSCRTASPRRDDPRRGPSVSALSRGKECSSYDRRGQPFLPEVGLCSQGTVRTSTCGSEDKRVRTAPCPSTVDSGPCGDV